MSKLGLSVRKLSGLLESYQLSELLAQGWEKLFCEKKRYRSLHGIPPYSQQLDNQIKEKCYISHETQTILLVTHAFFPDSVGGTERFTFSLANELRALGNRVVICAYSNRDSRSYMSRCGDVIWSCETYKGIEVVRFRLEHPNGSVLKNVQEDGYLIQPFFQMLTERFKPDVVHFTHCSRVSGLMCCCQKSGVPYVVTLTDFFLVCHFSTMVDAKGRYCEGSLHGQRCATQCQCFRIQDSKKRYQAAERLLKGAAAVAAPSRFVAERFEVEMPEIKIHVIPHGIADDPDKRRTSGGIIKSFAYVGALTQAKGTELLIRAFRSMPEDCTLTIYGGGKVHEIRRLRWLARGRNNIRFYGPLEQDEVSQAYKSADCVVIPSLVPETYGFVLREALLNGCFVIASRIGALPEAVTPENGILFEPGNCSELEQALKSAEKVQHNVNEPLELPSCRNETVAYLNLYHQKERS